MIFLKVLLISVIFHCVSSAAVGSDKENPFVNVADYARSGYGGAVPQPKPEQPVLQSAPQLLPLPPASSRQVIYYFSSCGGIQPQPPVDLVPIHPQLKIPFGYTHTPSVGIHKYHVEKKCWDDARKTCINEGGHLAVINSAEEQTLFHKVSLESKIADEAWIGVHDLFKKSEWTTVLDVPLNNVGFINWMPGEPNNVGGNEHCITYSAKNNAMKDQNCAGERPFFCEVPIY